MKGKRESARRRRRITKKAQKINVKNLRNTGGAYGL